MRGAITALAAGAALCLVPVAGAGLEDEAALADRYAPVVRLVAQAQECGYGESYEPIDLDALFDEPTVALRGPWGDDLVKIAPVAADLSPKRFEYHLDFPGNALDPGCDYERWSKRLTKGAAPTVYAHVAMDPGHPDQLALQYWFYYVFNDWNNTHEGDWEMIQLVFDARDAREALSRAPFEVGYSQHEGAERAEWGEDDKLEVVEGTHPVVHPAAGSHANFYGEALHLGRSASEGVGCDDTTGPTIEIRPDVRTIPSDTATARRQFPWIEFAGRWGELQRSIFNGPTGPNLKTQWTRPVEWSEGWRSRSVAVPGGGALGTGATDFFCGAVAAGSNALRRVVNEPLTLLVLFALLALVAYLLSRTSWRPGAPLRLARRRTWGQVLSASTLMYVRRFGLFLGLGLIALPISIVVTLLQAGLLEGSSFLGIPTEGEGGGVAVYIAVVLGTALTLTGLGFVQAATAHALVKIDEGAAISPIGAYRLALASLRRLLVAVLIASFAVSLLVSTIFLVPIAIWLAVRWALVAPVVALEGRTSRAALGRSGRLVRRGWLKVASLVVVGAALALLAGPFVGALLILLTDAPIWVLNIVSGVVYVVVLPFVALATVYVYLDMRVRDELAEEEGASTLPAEIAISG